MANPSCCVCNASKATLCSVCHSAAYCSDTCKQDDAHTHQLLCQEFASFVANSSRPCPSAIIALYFPILEYGKKALSAPKILWVDPKHGMDIVERESDGTVEYTDALKHDPFEAKFTEPRDMSSPVASAEHLIDYNLLAKFRLRDPIVLRMRDAWNFDGSRFNLTLIKTTREQLRQGIKGPLILHSEAPQDITLSDFRTFIDFCKVYQYSGSRLVDCLRTNTLVELELTNPILFHSLVLYHSDKILKGVEITCEGDKKFLGLEQYVSVDVSNVHPIFDDVNRDQGYIAGFGATEVSKMIDIPLLVRRIFPDERWNHGTQAGPTNYHNPIAEYFNITMDINSPNWGSRDPGRPPGHIYGRVLVVREDQISITARQVEVFATFFKSVFEIFKREKFQSLKGVQREKLHEARTKLMTEHISRVEFEKFFRDFRKQKISEGDSSWADEKSPYEVTKTESDEDGIGEKLKALDLGSGLEDGE